MQKLVNQTYQLAENAVESFRKQLILDEKREATIQKYTHDVRRFLSYHGKQTVCKEDVIQYKAWLAEHYAVRSANSMLIALNQFLRFQGAGDCCVKPLKVQRQTFCDKKKELSQAEYFRLLEAARRNGDMRLHLAIQTICATGIRVSELAYITVEAARRGRADIALKGKLRTILLPARLCRRLLKFAGKNKIAFGAIFLTKSGRPLSRTQIWAEMKCLCAKAGVAAEKVFPHNLRHLFARTFYELKKDVVKLADIMGHSSIETTRIYTATSGKEYRRQMELLGLVI